MEARSGPYILLFKGEQSMATAAQLMQKADQKRMKIERLTRELAEVKAKNKALKEEIKAAKQ